MDDRIKKNEPDKKWAEQFERISKRISANVQTRPRIAAIIVGLVAIALLWWWFLGPASQPVASGRTTPPTPVSLATVQTFPLPRCSAHP